MLTPRSDQYYIKFPQQPHQKYNHTVWRTWLFIASTSLAGKLPAKTSRQPTPSQPSKLKYPASFAGVRPLVRTLQMEVFQERGSPRPHQDNPGQVKFFMLVSGFPGLASINDNKMAARPPNNSCKPLQCSQ